MISFENKDLITGVIFIVCLIGGVALIIWLARREAKKFGLEKKK